MNLISCRFPISELRSKSISTYIYCLRFSEFNVGRIAVMARQANTMRVRRLQVAELGPMFTNSTIWGEGR